MNNLLPKNENFSSHIVVPTGHDDSDQFEFGYVTTPGSPDSPADHLFSNGRLRPHVFPVHRPSKSLSRSASRTSSSISSKGSLVSSRSSSTNSSARTSTSTEASSTCSERRLYNYSNRTSARRKNINVTMNSSSNYNNKPNLCSQRWQLIAAAPVLKHQGRSRSKTESLDRKMSKKSRPVEEEKALAGTKTPWFGRKILKSFVSACKECHAITT